MQLDTLGLIDDEYFDDQNDMADGCDSTTTPTPHPESIPPLKNDGPLPEPISIHGRLDRHPGQGFLDRLRLAHLGVAEKEVLEDHAISERN